MTQEWQCYCLDLVRENTLNAASGMPASLSAVLALSLSNAGQGFLGLTPTPAHGSIPHQLCRAGNTTPVYAQIKVPHNQRGGS